MKLKRGLLLLCSVIALLGVALGIYSRRERHKRIQAALPPEVQQVLDKSDKFYLYSLQAERLPEADLRIMPNLHGYPISGQTRVRPKPQRADLIRALWGGLGRGGQSERFSPRYGVRAVRNGKTVDLLIGFGCEQMEIYDDRGLHRITVSSSVQTIFSHTPWPNTMSPCPNPDRTMANPKKRPRRRRILGIACGLFFLACLCAAIDYWGYPYGAALPGHSFNRGENGLWLRYTWYFGKQNEAERRLLAHQLQERQIRYAYFHVRFIGKTGKLAFHYPNQAQTLTMEMHRDAPGVKSIAWVYVSYGTAKDEVHLTDAKTRQTMIAEALWLVQACGFDGVQWDVEPISDGDASFLALMRETRAALPPGKLLSTATAMWAPAALQQTGWSDTYFAQVAATCDQMAVMCYDSGYLTPRAYVWLVRQQAIHVTHAAGQGNPHGRVLLGVPTYGKGFFSHNPRAENLPMALRGVRAGLEDPAANASIFAGIAPFADYTTSAQDWQTYTTLWSAPTPQRTSHP